MTQSAGVARRRNKKDKRSSEKCKDPGGPVRFSPRDLTTITAVFYPAVPPLSAAPQVHRPDDRLVCNSHHQRE